ncbi:hypothetical protein GE09DRAFT_1196234 [Coniochaeta sp. 2T2.1]|nr:hypothetical protein GE09DRAFT_1196234 [Coniochaeta sp. 2T2.1]
MSFSQQSNRVPDGVPRTASVPANPSVNDVPRPSNTESTTALHPTSATTLSQLPASVIWRLDEREMLPADTSLLLKSLGRSNIAGGGLPYRADRPISTTGSDLMPPPATIPHRNQADTATQHQNYAMGKHTQNTSQARSMAQPTQMPQQQDAPEQVGMAAHVCGHAERILGAYRALPQPGLAQPPARPSLDLRIHEKEIHGIWWCTVPGCKRDKPFVNKHSVTRHVRDIHDKAAKPPKPSPKVPTAEDAAAATASYLAGHEPQHPAGSVFAPRKRQRTEGPPVARDSKENAEHIANLEAENARLNGLLRKFAEEVKTLRAETETKEQQRADRENQDYDALSRGFSNEMDALIGDGGGPRDVEALRAEIKARHERQMKEALERHQEKERRLWELLRPQ